MLNQQRPTGRTISDGSTLLVHSIFPTIQGEGPFAGIPALFIRLAGCNLQCPLCDTEYTDNAKMMPVADIVHHAGLSRLGLVVLTGGEPFRQNVALLLNRLRHCGIHTQIETNGVLPIQDQPKVETEVALGFTSIVCSPKSGKLAPVFGHLSSAFKYVVKAGDVCEDGLPRTALDNPPGSSGRVAPPPPTFKKPIYIQPADEKSPEANALNMQQAVDSVLMYPANRRLCIQMHKYAELP